MKKKIGIVGSGTMGAGIAQVAAKAGHEVVVFDLNTEILAKAKSALEKTCEKLVEKGKMSADEGEHLKLSISWVNELTALKESDLVIEAIVERLDIKQQVFQQLESLVSEICILASNTSSLSITSIAASCKNSERVIGIHFFNPAPLMELVEIVPALQTSEDVTKQSIELINSWKKKTVKAKDTPGFIVNRIARPFYSEAIRLYEEGLASISEIDGAMKVCGGFRMGPFELMDLIGHDVNYAVTESVWTAFYFDPRYTPSFSQKRLVEAKWLGKKTGRGFYQYDASVVTQDNALNILSAEQIFERILMMLINEAAHALHMQVASKEDLDLAMTKGVNYPKGLLLWADEKGIGHCVESLDMLYETYHEDRYRCSPLLRKMQQEKTSFYH
ncbi:MAG: NAD(P)-binding domain-containing protein [Chitinophagaceae bacterium]|nr:NAD(P)-binding domain-containing protein [Chitinophagaceae bacterium]